MKSRVLFLLLLFFIGESFSPFSSTLWAMPPKRIGQEVAKEKTEKSDEEQEQRISDTGDNDLSSMIERREGLEEKDLSTEPVVVQKAQKYWNTKADEIPLKEQAGRDDVIMPKKLELNPLQKTPLSSGERTKKMSYDNDTEREPAGLFEDKNPPRVRAISPVNKDRAVFLSQEGHGKLDQLIQKEPEKWKNMDPLLKKADEMEREKNRMLQEMESQFPEKLIEASAISKATANMIDRISSKCEKLESEKRIADVYQLSGIWEKLIAAKNAVDFASVPSEHPDRRQVLALTLAIETAKKNIQDATRIVEGPVENQVNRNEAKISSPVFSEIKFQQCADAVMDYATKTDEAIHDVFSYFTMDGEFGDQTDHIDLSDACDSLDAAIAILNMVRETTIDANDPLNEIKQEFAITNVEQATEKVDSIAQRIKEYPQDRLTREILKNLQKIKEKYQALKTSIG